MIFERDNMTANATVAIGAFFPPGTQENGKLFLKLDGINDGLFVHFNNQWLKLSKVSSLSDGNFSPAVTAPTLEKYVNNQLDNENIMIGGSF